MTKKQYPHAESSAQPRWKVLADAGKGPPCRFPGCTQHATHRVEIEVNWFRGDDERSQACAAHKNCAVELLAELDQRRAAEEAQRKAKAAQS